MGEVQGELLQELANNLKASSNYTVKGGLTSVWERKTKSNQPNKQIKPTQPATMGQTPPPELQQQILSRLLDGPKATDLSSGTQCEGMVGTLGSEQQHRGPSIWEVCSSNKL